MRRFVLERTTDVSGVSGTGIVVEGIEFTDKTVAIRWTTEYRSTTIWSSIYEMMKVHGHDGATTLIWIDKDTELPDILTE